jgi:pyruvate/2-oxoglutarate dehydrogenase complex dihydrolipoamide acyltransferase (E2) component
MTEIIMPKMGLNMSEGTIVEWLAKSGDQISQGQEIASIESEKVVNNLEAESSGILHIAVQAGETVPVGEVIGYLLEAGEKPPEALKSGVGAAGADTAYAANTKRAAGAAGAGPKDGSAAVVRADAEIRVFPAARRKAKTLGVDLSGVTGTGPGGRITIEDVEKAAGQTGARGPGAAGAAEAAGKRIPFTGVRKAIADAMSSSQRNAAEVTLTTEVDCSRLVAAHNSGTWKQKAAKISYNAMFIQIAAAGLKAFPHMNARLENDAIVQLEEINVGLAVQAEQGLVVPVVAGADGLTIEKIQKKIEELVDKVQSSRATPDDFTGGTFTVTNLGAYGIDAFTPIINPGQTAILGVGRITERAVVLGGKVEVRPTCVLSLTFDHRLVDGAPAAEFLNNLKDSIEDYNT